MCFASAQALLRSVCSGGMGGGASTRDVVGGCWGSVYLGVPPLKFLTKHWGIRIPRGRWDFSWHGGMVIMVQAQDKRRIKDMNKQEIRVMKCYEVINCERGLFLEYRKVALCGRLEMRFLVYEDA